MPTLATQVSISFLLALLVTAPLRAAAQSTCDHTDPAASRRSSAHSLQLELDGLGRIQPAADAGDPDAENLLGVLYGRGTGGLPQDAVASFKWHQKAAEHGNARGQSNLAIMYMNGEGTEKNLDRALSWAQKSAAQADAQGFELMGYMYGAGVAVDRDLEEAHKCYLQAANLGDIKAQEQVARDYFKGLGVAVDQKLAMLWARRSVEAKRSRIPWTEKQGEQEDPLDASYDPRYDLAVINLWKGTPEVITKRCDLVDPDGTNVRAQSLAARQLQQKGLLEHINTVTRDAIALTLIGSPKVDPLAYENASVVVSVERHYFAGLSAEDLKKLCSDFTQGAGVAPAGADPDARVQRSLDKVDRWLAGR